MKKKVAQLKADKDAEAFLGHDLSGLDCLQSQASRFEFEKKDTQLNLRLPKPLSAAGKICAKARGSRTRGSFAKCLSRS